VELFSEDRRLTRLTLGRLTFADDGLGLAEGSCTGGVPLLWPGGPPLNCSNGYEIEYGPDEVAEPPAALDPLSGGATRLTVSRVVRTSPLPGESVVGPTLRLLAATEGAPLGSITVKLVKPLTGEVVRARVDPLAGTVVTGLTAGRWEASWTATSLREDTVTTRTRFSVQDGPPTPPPAAEGPGPVSAPGGPGPARPADAPGPRARPRRGSARSSAPVAAGRSRAGSRAR
jgi:hypothetical protein